jgi:hypothetical protein
MPTRQTTDGHPPIPMDALPVSMPEKATFRMGPATALPIRVPTRSR